MKITDIEAIVLVWPPPEKHFWTALRPIGRVNELLVRVYTDDGIVGIGEAHSAGMGFPGIYRETADGAIAAAGASKLVAEVLKPLLAGEDPLDNERLWEKMFRLNHQVGWASAGWGRPQVLTAIAGVDIALWDIKGKAANLPVYKLLGGARNTVPCYVTGGYYQDGKTVSDLVHECETYADMGYQAIKLKIGHVSVEEDVERVRAVRESLGPDMDLMLDVNEGYDVPTAIRAARLLEPYDIRWLEEPVHWYDRIEGLGKVAESTTIPIASGGERPAPLGRPGPDQPGWRQGHAVRLHPQFRHYRMPQDCRDVRHEQRAPRPPPRPASPRTPRGGTGGWRDCGDFPHRRPRPHLGGTVHRPSRNQEQRDDSPRPPRLGPRTGRRSAQGQGRVGLRFLHNAL